MNKSHIQNNLINCHHFVVSFQFNTTTSDMDYDLFDYGSSHDSSYYDDLIDQYEHYRSFKCKKTKQRQSFRSYCVVSMKTLKSNSYTIRLHCFHDEKTPKAQPKKFRYERSGRNCTSFDCDELYDIKADRHHHHHSSIQKQQQMIECLAKNLEIDSSTQFSSFQRDFYRDTHRFIKSSCADEAKVKLTNIRPAPVTPFVQNQFMNRLQQEPIQKPYLTFHATAVGNFESILRFGFLIPNKQHPDNPNAPIITVQHGQSYGVGIYSSLTPGFTMSYSRNTNTIFACAALPHRTKTGQITRRHGNILVLPSESRIIPLFLVDFIHTTGAVNYSIYAPPKPIIEKKLREQEVKPKYVTRKYLRKTLNYINDDQKQNNRYQIRSFEL